MANKLRPQAASPLIEHLKAARQSTAVGNASKCHVMFQSEARERLVDLAELSGHISEIAQDQYGSRLPPEISWPYANLL